MKNLTIVEMKLRIQKLYKEAFQLSNELKDLPVTKIDPQVFTLLKRIKNIKSIIARFNKVNEIRFKRYKRGLPDIEILID